MITHYLQDKNVQWFELKEVRDNKGRKDFERVQHKGRVEMVDSTGTIALIKEDNKPVVKEIAELVVV